MNLWYWLGLDVSLAADTYGIGTLIALAFGVFLLGGLLFMAAVAAFGK